MHHCNWSLSYGLLGDCFRYRPILSRSQPNSKAIDLLTPPSLVCGHNGFSLKLMQKGEGSICTYLATRVWAPLTEVQFSDASPFLGKTEKPLHFFFFFFWEMKAQWEWGAFPVQHIHSFICTLNNLDFLYIAQIIPPWAFLPHSQQQRSTEEGSCKLSNSVKAVSLLTQLERPHPPTCWNWKTLVFFFQTNTTLTIFDITAEAEH